MIKKIIIFHNYFSYLLLVIEMRIKEGILKDNDISLETLEVDLGNTTLLILEGYKAFAMCGALNVDVYNSEKMKARNVICIRALGVKTLEELYEAKAVEVSEAGINSGLAVGMSVKDCFEALSKK